MDRVYYLAYKAPLGKREDGTIYYREGRQEIYPKNDIEIGIGVVDYMNLIYGQNTHWIEIEDGTIVYIQGKL